MELQTSGKRSGNFPQKAQHLRTLLKYKRLQKPGMCTTCSDSNARDTEPTCSEPAGKRAALLPQKDILRVLQEPLQLSTLPQNACARVFSALCSSRCVDSALAG